tara:strand:- start:5388 stop:5624 length:237 start_codon:yes stop_codon:yes gene_type:complete
MNKILFSPEEVAKILWGDWNNTTRKRVYKFLKEEKILGIKNGSTWWVSKSELQKLGYSDQPSTNQAKPFVSSFNIGND